jgi:hypothetical protein
MGIDGRIHCRFSDHISHKPLWRGDDDYNRINFHFKDNTMEEAIFKDIWKFIFIIAIIALGYFLNKYTSKIEQSIEKLTEGFNRLSEILGRHEERIEDLEEKHVVKYRK